MSKWQRAWFSLTNFLGLSPVNEENKYWKSLSPHVSLLDSIQIKLKVHKKRGIGFPLENCRVQVLWIKKIGTEIFFMGLLFDLTRIKTRVYKKKEQN